MYGCPYLTRTRAGTAGTAQITPPLPHQRTPASRRGFCTDAADSHGDAPGRPLHAARHDLGRERMARTTGATLTARAGAAWSSRGGSCGARAPQPQYLLERRRIDALRSKCATWRPHRTQTVSDRFTEAKQTGRAVSAVTLIAPLEGVC